MVICDPSKITSKRVEGAPDLVVEVLSLSTARNDRGKKFRAYERAGVREYWIVDPKKKSVEVYLLQDGKFEIDNIYTWCPIRERENLTEVEQNHLSETFQCSLFDDLTIHLEDIFYRVP